MTLTFGSLFRGIGGFDLGFERAGMQCAWQCEIDPKANAVAARHWPGIPVIEDVRNVTANNVEPVDVICGGFPCQDLSVAGKRAGLAGSRSGLWFEFHRILSELTPQWVVIENVPGLLSSNSGRDFAVILRGLGELGYLSAWRVLDAQYFGVAQRRRRVFIVASLGDGRAAEVLFERESLPGDPAPRREAGERPARTVAYGSTSDHYDPTQQDYIPTWGIDSEQNALEDGIGTLRAHGSGGMEQFCAFPMTYRMEAFGKYTDDETAGAVKALDFKDATDLVAFQQNTRDEVRLFNGDGAIAGALSAEPGMKQQNYLAFQLTGDRDNPSVSTYADVMPTIPANPMSDRQAAIAFTERTRTDGRSLETQDDLAYSLTDKSKGGNPHSSKIAGGFGVRRLTPVECERLQGFPDGWTAGQADSSRYRQLGNAVCVNVLEWIGRRIVEASA